MKKAAANRLANGHATNSDPNAASTLADVDYPVFHSPYGKMVQKAHARLVYNDFLANPDAPRYANVPERDAWLAQSHKVSLTDKNLEKTFMAVAKADFEGTVEKGMRCARRCGNMYTASLYGGLASLVSAVAPEDLLGKRIQMFAFGSGCAASVYCIRVKGSTEHIRNAMDLLARLQSTKVVPCQEYVDSLKMREENHNAKEFAPKGSLDNLWPGSYYLTRIDEKYRRFYDVVPEDQTS